MLKVKDYYNLMDEYAPFDTALSHDNTGLLVGNMQDDVNGILLALDITYEVIMEAKAKGANLIISHHPIIYGGLDCITTSTAAGRICHALIKNSMSAICAHTNLDIAKGGVSDCFAEAIGLLDIKGVNDNAMLRVGELRAAMDVNEFALHVKENVGAERVRVSGRLHDKISKVAVLGGSGGEFFMDAFKTGADIFVVGSAKQHEGLAVDTMNFCMMDAGHYETEVLVLKRVHSYLQNCIDDVQSISTIRITSVRTGPFSVIC